MPKVTISDVAAAAGISMKSVSRVINREPNVSGKLRARVQAAIDQLGYVPDMAARSLAGARAYTIGLLLDNPSPHYTMKVQEGAWRACRDHGYHLLIENIDSGAGDVATQMKAILSNCRVDGFVLTPPLTEIGTVMDLLEQRSIPFVRIAPVSFTRRSAGFSMDDARAAGEIARHFWALGHRTFALVTGPPEHGAAATRKAGFLATLAELGHRDPVAEAYGAFRFDRGIEAGRELLSADSRPTAIFAMNDDSAAGVMSAASQLGLRVPQDVAVAGFDDSWVAKSVWPYLTTVHQPIAEMADMAATFLIERAVYDADQSDTLLDHALVVRGSTKAAQ